MLRMLGQTYRRSGAVSCGALLIALTLQTSGCTAIGLGIGSAVDAKKPNRERIPASQWARLEPDQEVLVERNGELAVGRLRLVEVSATDSVSVESAAADGIDDYPASVLFSRSLGRTRYLRQQLADAAQTQDTIRVPSTEIIGIYRPVPRSGKLIGVLIGFAVDVAVLMALASALEGPWGFQGS